MAPLTRRVQVLTFEISFLCQTDQLVSYSSSGTARISLFLVTAGDNFLTGHEIVKKNGIFPCQPQFAIFLPAT